MQKKLKASRCRLAQVTPHVENRGDCCATYIYRTLNAMQDDYDAVVIGSGLGGLRVGALFAYAGHRVLLYTVRKQSISVRLQSGTSMSSSDVSSQSVWRVATGSVCLSNVEDKMS